MGELDENEKSVLAQTGYEYLLPIITKYNVTTAEQTNALIAAFQAGAEFALKETKKV
jgi:hypothetical protein